MNTFCNNYINKNFNKACEMSEQDFTHSELMQMLKNGDIMQKQIAALNLDNIDNSDEALILLNNLTGCDGKIREAIAYKINDILNRDTLKLSLFIGLNAKISANVLADATIDINGNICKFVLNIVKILTVDENFIKIYSEKIVSMIFSTFDAIDKFIYRDKKYVINKQLFKLYWCLESIKICKKFVDSKKLEYILNRASKENEYTIREKVAQIISDINDKRYIALKTELSNDRNYYVRIALAKN